LSGGDPARGAPAGADGAAPDRDASAAVTDYLPLLHALADRADAIATKHYRSVDLAISIKGDRTPVTNADLEIEREVRAMTAASGTGLAIVGEEFGEATDTGAGRLIVDPIDGTANFMRGIPIFASLLAVEAGGKLVAGVVSAPAMSLRWDAARGRGARVNGSPIRVSPLAKLAESQVFYCGFSQSTADEQEMMLRVIRRAKRDRGFGDFLEHLWVAEGRGEAAIDFGLKPWDIAAVAIVVEEAGGRATGLDGGNPLAGSVLVSTNGAVHEETLAVLRGEQ
jgi:histidinol-phosphatase